VTLDEPKKVKKKAAGRGGERTCWDSGVKKEKPQRANCEILPEKGREVRKLQNITGGRGKI